MSWKAIALVLSGVVIGCGAGAAVRARADVPAMPPGGPTERYQYTCRDNENPSNWSAKAQAMLNEMGAQGWRLLGPHGETGGDHYVYCFERRY